MSAARPREVRLLIVAMVGVLALAGLFVGWLLHAASAYLPGNEDVLLRNATGGEITDVVVMRGAYADQTEVARIARIAPGGQALTSPGLGTLSIEFSDARGRWVAERVLWRDEDDVRGQAEPELIDIAADRVGKATVRRKP